MIEIRDLTKTYDTFIAVNHSSFDVEDGKITILLGQNGAGKSTTIKSIAGLLSYSGQIFLDGRPNTSSEAKRRLGYIPETPCLYDTLTVEEHVHFIGKAYRIPDYMVYAEELMERLELSDKKKKLARELSKGMTQKLSMVLALMIKPHSLLVDEPMVGLDPAAIEEVLKILQDLKMSGTAVLISTHIIDIITDIWDQAFIMDQGKIIKAVSREEADSRGESLKQMFFEAIGGDQNERT